MQFMKASYLIKYGEIALKKGNRKKFEQILKRNLKDKFKGIPTVVSIQNGRFFLEVEDLPEEEVHQRLSTLFGIVAFYKNFSCTKDLDSIAPLAIEIARRNLESGLGYQFKVETRRIDKSLPMTNQQYSSEIGARILEAIPELKVNVREPQWILNLELRDKAYIYGFGGQGGKGLPVGSAGRGMLLLSGGIDSPVASFLMSKRGLKQEAVYFHTPPYTSEESLQKVKDLAELLSPWNNGIKLHVINFTKIQLRINKEMPEATTTLHTRASMMKIATILAHERKCGALITGESLSQVASQTLESLNYTNSSTELAVFRPCIGMDKEEIIHISKRIGAFETSIQPFDDCCTLFSPEHPLVKPDIAEMQQQYQSMEDMEELLRDTARDVESFTL